MKKLKNTILKFLRAGLSPGKVSFAVAVGITMGIFPIYGPISLLCLALAWAARLNVPVLFAGYYSMTFIKPLLILPFLRLGELMFRSEPLAISLAELTLRFGEDAAGTLQDFGWSFVHAMAGWMVSAPVLMILIYAVTMVCIGRWHAARQGVPCYAEGEDR